MMILGLLLIIQLLLTVSVSVNFYPEMFVLPWLVGKGLVPYRDFFDHHGFLTYYLLAPLSFDKSLFLIKLFFLGLQATNLVFFYLIIHRRTNKSSRLIFGVFSC